MTTSVIICEFNPLHSGHKKLIDFAKSVSDNVICVMIGNFTQRGLPACASKFDRARHAVLAGADMVVELPPVFAVASAEDFAFGGVACANALNADYLVFGSECGDVAKLQSVADKLSNDEVNRRIKSLMAQGSPYPKAVATAVQSDILDSPNNVLAVEYIRAITRSGNKITPLTIARENNYNDLTTANFASSSAIRADETLLERYSFPFVAKDFSTLAELRYKSFLPIALSLFAAQDYEQICGVSEGIENRFVAADKSQGYDVMMDQIKTKRYTRLKLQRIALCAALGITTEIMTEAKTALPSVIPLAVKKGKEKLLALLPATNDVNAEILHKADSLYRSLSGCEYPSRLQII